MSNDSNWYANQQLGMQNGNAMAAIPRTADSIRDNALSVAKQRFKAIQEHIDAVPALREEQTKLISLIGQLTRNE